MLRNFRATATVEADMTGLNMLSIDVMVRATRLGAAILLIGGLVAGPAAHLAATAAGYTTAESSAQHEPGGPKAPDSHHDCPVCMTLASGVVPVVVATPASRLGNAGSVVPLQTVPLDRAGSDLTRARAPPAF